MASTQMEKKRSVPEITLRHFKLSDVDDFMAWASDERVTQFSRRDPYTSREEALNYIKNTIIPHQWYRAICLEDRPVGSISVKGGSGEGICRASIGYRLAYKHWGKGMATLALKKVVTTIFEEWPQLERVEAIADVENPASQRVLEKAGFLREGVLRKYTILKGRTRDMVMYSFVSTGSTVSVGW